MPEDREHGHAALRRGRVSIAGQVYHVSTATVGRTPWFLDPQAARGAGRCFHHQARLGGFLLLAWVLMPDHAHMLLELRDGQSLGGVVGRLKSVSGREANRILGRVGALWAKAYHDHAVRAEEDLPAVARYIVANPVRAGLVRRAGDYPYWDAVWL